jgi:hypothetical protein
MSTFNDVLATCLKTGLSASLISRWTDHESAIRYWQVESVPLVESMGLKPLSVSLLSEGDQDPSLIFIHGLYATIAAKQPAVDTDFFRALSDWKKRYGKVSRPGALMIFGMDALAQKRWRSELAALRAAKQAMATELFFVFSCVGEEAFRSLFVEYDAPLYRDGFMVKLDKQGRCQS